MFWRHDCDKRDIDDVLKREDISDIEQDLEVEKCDPTGDVFDDRDKSEDADNERPVNPFKCFGMDEEKTDRWLAKFVKFWYCIMSLLWFFFGAITFAPVIFISNRVNVIFKSKKKSLLFSIVLYIGFLALIFVLI
jgi:hypothetical protein